MKSVAGARLRPVVLEMAPAKTLGKSGAGWVPDFEGLRLQSSKAFLVMKRTG